MKKPFSIARVALFAATAFFATSTSSAQSLLPGEHDWQPRIFEVIPNSDRDIDYPFQDHYHDQYQQEFAAFCWQWYDHLQTQNELHTGLNTYLNFCEPVPPCDPSVHTWPYEDCIDFSFYAENAE